jgi:putative membrane protein
MMTTIRSLFPFDSFQARSTAVLAILHSVGLLGLIYYEELFRPLTPFLLLVVTALLFSDHDDFRPRFCFFALGVVVLGMAIEILGVRTGTIFGDYRYSSVFGPAIAGVPLLIGIDWLLLTYLTLAASGRLVQHPLLTPLLGAIFMVGLDVLLEPVAIEMKFWIWEEGTPPLRNYMAWFLMAFFFHFIAWTLGLRFRSRVAIPLLIILVLFFLSILLTA